MANRPSTDDIGKRYGRLVVEDVEIAFIYGKYRSMAICICDCGSKHYVGITTLRSGAVKSCGCLHSEASRQRMTTHGKTHTREHRIWKNMRNRCNNPNHPRYADWGGRGIKICDRWNVFQNFIDDMGKCPDGYTIERIDNNKGYEPNNCKWATMFEQTQNSRKSRYITYNGQTLAMSEWARRAQIPYNALRSRLNRKWTDEEALTLPLGAKRK